MLRIVPWAVASFLSSAVNNVAQSFSIYIPYAATTIFNVLFDGQRSETKSAHWLCTALYNGSPVRFAMFAPDAKSVVAQIAFMSPAMSNVPDVDNEFDFVFAKTALIPASFWADDDLSRAVLAADSPAVAVIMALTSAAVFGITSMFRLLKSCN